LIPSRHRSLASLLLLGALLFAAVAGAQDDKWIRLASDADVIVAGECAAERSSWDDVAGIIVTTIEFQPRRFYKGELARTLTIKTLGGRVGDQSMAASHGASLASGEQVLLFLKRSEFGPYFVVAGGDEGKVQIEGLPDDAGGAPTMGTRAELNRLLNRGSATP